jgi:hypothetical protein
MKTPIILLVAPFLSVAAWADPAAPDSDVQARLDQIERIVVTADVRTAEEVPITDAQIAAILSEAAAREDADD